MADAPLRLDFHFDVMCPWAYQTSRWIREVRVQNGLEITWKFFSLEEINRVEGKKHPWERPWSYGWSLLRLGALLRRQSMDEVDRFYATAGRALHEEGRKVHTPEGAQEVLAELGLDPTLVDAALADDTTHDEVRADHNAVVARGGFGVPTLVFPNGATLFGPVITPAPTGKAALRLWDLTAGWAEFPHLYEIRRSKTAADFSHIEAQFDTYYRARDWKTIQNPAP
jgi:2-hydroxychromene-2-carboxylate isomerase